MPASKNSIFSSAKKVGKHLTVYVNNLKGIGYQVPGNNYRRDINVKKKFKFSDWKLVT